VIQPIEVSRDESITLFKQLTQVRSANEELNAVLFDP